jgi:hypothetical protein
MINYKTLCKFDLYRIKKERLFKPLRYDLALAINLILESKGIEKSGIF